MNRVQALDHVHKQVTSFCETGTCKVLIKDTKTTERVQKRHDAEGGGGCVNAWEGGAALHAEGSVALHGEGVVALHGEGGGGGEQQRGGGEGSIESSSAYIRLMGAKGLQAVISLPVGMGSSPLDPGHQMRQALQACCRLIICHMQPGLHILITM